MKKLTKGDMDGLIKVATEAGAIMREMRLRPMLEAGFTRSQAEWIADNLLEA